MSTVVIDLFNFMCTEFVDFMSSDLVMSFIGVFILVAIARIFRYVCFGDKS